MTLYKYFFLNIIFSGDLEITVEFLTEIDKLVQLIESPVFACECYLFFISFTLN